MKTKETACAELEQFCRTRAAFTAVLAVLLNQGARRLKAKRATLEACNRHSSGMWQTIYAMAIRMAFATPGVLVTFLQRTTPLFQAHGLPVPPEHPLGHEKGVCPRCGGALAYSGDNITDDDGGVFPWRCPFCGATGKEGYTAVFDRHYSVRDENGAALIPGGQPSPAPVSSAIQTNQ